ncbi:MAG: hypothetical protein AB7G93_08725 [Bdellovibrionales bacterium]
MKFMLMVIMVSTVGLSRVLHAEFVDTPYELTYFSDKKDIETHNREIAQVQDFIKKAFAKGWNVTYSDQISTTFAMVHKKAGQTIESMAAESEGCSLAEEPQCWIWIRNVNRREEVLAPEYEGEVSLPIQRVEYKIKIEAGSHYREEVIGRTTNAVISLELLGLLRTVASNTWGRASVFCAVTDNPDTCFHYNLRVDKRGG